VCQLTTIGGFCFGFWASLAKGVTSREDETMRHLRHSSLGFTLALAAGAVTTSAIAATVEIAQ
jgi:hypothetical protein